VIPVAGEEIEDDDEVPVLTHRRQLMEVRRGRMR